MLTLSENEIDQQKNTVTAADSDELFASFAAPKKLQPPPRQVKPPLQRQEQAAAQITSFLNNLPEKGGQTDMPQLQLEEEPAATIQESEGVTAAGWGDEEDMDINIE